MMLALPASCASPAIFVRLTDDGDLDAVVLFLRLVRLREVREAGIQQVAGAVTVHGGNGDGIAET